MSAERSGYASRQAQLLAALISGTGFPPGFSLENAQAASRALTAKRARAVTATWPALTHELGESFSERFDAYARATAGPPTDGGAIADGLAFAATLEQPPSDSVRVELAFARAVVARRHGRPAPRRGPYLTAIRLGEPRRLLVVLRLPGGDPHPFVLALRRS